MASLVTKTVGGPSADYKTWKAFCAANVNLVAADEYWEVTLAPGLHVGGAEFHGWTLDSTRYLHIKGTNTLTKIGHVPDTNSTDSFIAAYNTNIGTGRAIGIRDNGVGALIIFEDVAVVQWASVSLLYIYGSQACTVRFKNCSLTHMNNTAASGVNALFQTNANHELQLINSCAISENTTYNRGQGTFKFYNTTIRSRSNYGINANVASSACTLYNCYIACTGGTSIFNIGAASVTNTATHDATGSIGLQNILYSHVNIRSLSRRSGDARIMPGSSLIGGGATLVGLPAPFDYTTDIFGAARTMATPDVGCYEFDGTESPVAISRTVEAGSWDTDYSSLNAYAALNLNLVALDQVHTIEYEPSTSTDAITATFDGWTTDATRFVTVRNVIEDGGVRYGCWGAGHYYAAAPARTGRILTNVAGSGSLVIGAIGASGLLVVEGISIFNNNGTGKGLELNANASGGTIRMVGCKFGCSGNSAGYGLDINAAAAAQVQLLNCFVLAGAGGAVRNRSATALVKAYHCTFSRTSNVVGDFGNTVDLNNVAGCALVNCYAHNEYALGSCYANLTGATFTKCASHDATGSETALQSILYTDTNFWYVSGVTSPFPIPKEGSPLDFQGANLAGESPPFNLNYDISWVPRGATPTIGCYEQWGQASTTWTPRPTGFNPAQDRAVQRMATFNGKIYAGTEMLGASTGKVYESADGINWAASQVFGASQQCNGLAVLGGKLYAMYSDLIRIDEFDGAVWTNVAGNYLGGAAGNPAYGNGLVTYNDGVQDKLYCAHINVAGQPIHSSADGATWASEGAGFWNNGAYGLITDGTDLIAQCTYGTFMIKRGTTWYDGIGIHPYTTITGDPGLFGAGTEIYFACQDATLTTACWKIYKLDRSTWRWELKSYMENLSGTAGTNGTVAGGSVYLMGRDMNAGINVGHAQMHSRDEGAHWAMGKVIATVPANADSYPSVADGAWAGNTVEFNGRYYVGVGFGTQGGIVYETDVLLNAVQLDDVDYESGEFRKSNYTATVCLRSDSVSGHPYSRLSLQTQDYTSDTWSKGSRDWSARYIRNYYTIPPANFWQWYRCAGQYDGAAPYVLEDGMRYMVRVYKESQIHWLQGPMLTVDDSNQNLIPVAYVPGGVTKLADSMAWSNICLFDAFSMKIRWLATCTNMCWRQTTEMLKIESGADWIKLEVLGSSAPEREYNLNDIYAPHEPLWRFSKGNGTTTEFSKTFVMYHGYNGTGSSNEWFYNDVVEFEILNYAGEISQCRVFRGNVEGFVYGSNPTAAGATSFGTLTLSGPGVWGSPKIVNVRNQTRETTNPRRTLLANRRGVPRRLAGTGRSPILNGERDPNQGIINPSYSNAFLTTETFNRANDPNLGDRWWTEERTGAGWYIQSNKAEVAQGGWERWDHTPKHRDYILNATCWLNNLGTKIGLVGRYERYRDDHTCYLLYVEDTGASSATLYLARYWEGVATVLASDALDKYTRSDPYHLMMTFDGNDISGNIYDEPEIIYLTDGSTDTFNANTASSIPVTPGRAVVRWVLGGTTYEMTDDGLGNFNPAPNPPYGGLDSGSIDYTTGEINLVFETPPDAGDIRVYQRLAVIAPTTDLFIQKPGRVGIYGFTTGAGNLGQLDNFYCTRNHNIGVN